ncbi:hypothetical protein Dimus_026430 [Dionaea muscipula]
MARRGRPRKVGVRGGGNGFSMLQRSPLKRDTLARVDGDALGLEDRTKIQLGKETDVEDLGEAVALDSVSAEILAAEAECNRGPPSRMEWRVKDKQAARVVHLQQNSALSKVEKEKIMKAPIVENGNQDGNEQSAYWQLAKRKQCLRRDPFDCPRQDQHSPSSGSRFQVLKEENVIFSCSLDPMKVEAAVDKQLREVICSASDLVL